MSAKIELFILIALVITTVIVAFNMSCTPSDIPNNNPYIGDMDGDGDCDNNDVTFLEQYIAGEQTQLYDFGDVNCDGEVNSYDVAVLQSYINGVIPEIYVNCGGF